MWSIKENEHLSSKTELCLLLVVALEPIRHPPQPVTKYLENSGGTLLLIWDLQDFWVFSNILELVWTSALRSTHIVGVSMGRFVSACFLDEEGLLDSITPKHIEARRRITNICALPLLLFFGYYLALADLINLLAQISDRIHYFTVYNLMPMASLTKFFNEQ